MELKKCFILHMTPIWSTHSRTVNAPNYFCTIIVASNFARNNPILIFSMLFQLISPDELKPISATYCVSHLSIYSFNNEHNPHILLLQLKYLGLFCRTWEFRFISPSNKLFWSGAHVNRFFEYFSSSWECHRIFQIREVQKLIRGDLGGGFLNIWILMWTQESMSLKLILESLVDCCQRIY